MPIKLRHIEALRALVAGQTVTRAAEILGVTQPAMSRILLQLEQGVGVELFQRRGQRLVLTGNGEIYFAEARNLLAAADHLSAVAEDLRHGRSGVLRVTVQSALSLGLLPEATARFTAKFPNASVNLQIKPRPELDSWIAAGRFDIGLGRMPVPDRDVTVEHLVSLESCCVIPHGHRLASVEIVSPADLQDETFISAARGTFFHYRVEEALNRENVRVRRIRVNTTEAAWALVSAGAGVSVVHGFARVAKNPHVIVKPFSAAISIDYGFIRSIGAAPSALAESFAEIVRDIAAECRQSG